MTMAEKLKELNPIDKEMMVEILHNANVTVSYNCGDNPTYEIAPDDMVKLMNYVYKIFR